MLIFSLLVLYRYTTFLVVWISYTVYLTISGIPGRIRSHLRLFFHWRKSYFRAGPNGSLPQCVRLRHRCPVSDDN